MDTLLTIHVEGTASGGFHLRWGNEFSTQPVAIYAGRSPETIDRSSPLVSAALQEAELTGLDSSIRHYFYLQPQNGEGLLVAQRNVPVEGGVNFRDIGGYATRDGRRVRWGTIFRSGHMAYLTDAGRAYLETLDIRTVCDFRLAAESKSEAASLPNNPRVEILSIPPGPKDPLFLHRLFERDVEPEAVVEAMHDIVRSLVVESAMRYAKLFEVLLVTRDENILINCSAGKERTGVGAALILTALGVPRETVFYDFMLSRKYFPAEAELDRVRKKYAVRTRNGRDDRELIMPLLDTRESYLRAAFDVVDEQYGSGEAFLRQTYGLTDAELNHLREKYTR